MVAIGSYGLEITHDTPLALISGPCQIESRDHSLMMADRIQKITQKNNVKLIFKSSFDKANRTSIFSARGVGIDEGLRILEEVKREFELPIITDVHEVGQCDAVAEVADILQIPAFLCRQTDLLASAARTKKTVMVKKGQFLAPQDMKYVAQKISKCGNENILLCERGVSFGYQNLVSDMRALTEMAKTGYPVVFDATHSAQMPGSADGATGGNREHALLLACAAVAVGVAAIFVECHNDPDRAPSDGPNMLSLD